MEEKKGLNWKDWALLGAVTLLGTVALVIGISLLLTFPFMWLWNGCLVGTVEGINEVGFLRAWGLSFLCHMIFRGIKFKTKGK